jgi:hypothetical protein
LIFAITLADRAFFGADFLGRLAGRPRGRPRFFAFPIARLTGLFDRLRAFDFLAKTKCD